MLLATAIKDLRTRYFVAKGCRHVAEIAEEIGLSRQALARFARGGSVGFRSCVKIENWVNTQEQSTIMTPAGS